MTPILFFGPVSDRFGPRRELVLPPEGLTVGALRRRLADEDSAGPEALFGPGVRIAVNQALADDDTLIRPGQEVAVMSPFSGG